MSLRILLGKVSPDFVFAFKNCFSYSRSFVFLNKLHNQLVCLYAEGAGIVTGCAWVL